MESSISFCVYSEIADFQIGLFILDHCAQASTVAVSAITGLLLQTLMLPSPGQSNLSEAIHHPRFAPLTKVEIV